VKPRPQQSLSARLLTILTATAVAASSAALTSCGSDNGTGASPFPTPVVSSLNKTVLSPGETLEISGDNFAVPASENRIVFNNNLAFATPFFATSDSMAVRVPANANTGGLFVLARGVASAKTNVTIQRGVGDVWVMGGGSTYEFQVPAPSGAEEYVVIPHSATGNGSSFGYSVATGTTRSEPPAPSVGGSGTTSIAQRFETTTRAQSIEYIRHHSPHGRAIPRARVAAAPPDTATFLVFVGDLVTDPAHFKTVTAVLRHEGSASYVYSDINQPSTGEFTPQEYRAFGMQFDADISPTNTTYFGAPSDVDGDGHVTILFTPEVNERTPDGQAGQGVVTGFFLLNDIAANILPPGTSNDMEIFYVFVPDPLGEFGNAFSKPQVAAKIPSTIAHEHEHMISFGYRFIEVGNSVNLAFTQELWMEEGMAHIAEDLNGLDADNIARVNLYLGNPRRTSLLGNAELRPYDIDTLEQRGCSYMFLRYLGDQEGDDIYKTLARSSCLGAACIESVTGRDFFATVADFLASLYLSDRAIASDPKYEFDSFDMQDVFAPLSITSQTVGGGSFGSPVRSATGVYFSVLNAQAPAIDFTVSNTTGGNIRLVVVRTR
jgi:hypothetical protein